MSLAPEVRDPLHGAIPVSPEELAILDHPLFQRLRHVKQLGFSDLSFPGATHTRYLHSIGAMHLAGQAFDAIFGDPDTPAISSDRRKELRRMLRAAALLHDVGHAPFSHASEFAMPAVGDLAIPVYAERPDLYPPSRQANHEDYTIKILTDSSLRVAIEADGGPSALAVAGLVDPRLPVESRLYEASGVDWRPLLQQLISSELDVDRMDYLARDSHYAGVHYGIFDVGWLMNHLGAHVVDGRACLALQDRAIYAFDDFLIARYHMFIMVYFHYRSMGYEEMLKQYFANGGDGYTIPTDIEQYAKVDDHHLIAHLRRSDDCWARRIVERREYKLLLERHGRSADVDITQLLDCLDDAGIPTLVGETRGELSKYFSGSEMVEEQERLRSKVGPEPDRPPPIWVLHQPYRGARGRRATRLEHSTALFERYRDEVQISRIYVPAEVVEAAGRLVHDIA